MPNQDIHHILKQYWGYDQFRPLQQDIIQSVLDGHDTLALLPTGGGKSVCFQVPGLALGGISLVISPLIALMNDQVYQLERRGVKAAAISSMMRRDEVEHTMEKCLQGEIQFLYVSPERLASENFREYLPNLDIRLLAIDEAHCISQWGYDFRPAYLKIAEIKPLLKNSKHIALTATATPIVAEDLIEKLQYHQAKVFRKSFVRSNLTYAVRYCSDKTRKLVEILNKVPGSSVVYVRIRKKTEETAAILEKNGITATFYHAGLDNITRKLRQEWWIDNKIRVVVCTNAFGMGIDKPDVRTVIHLDLPDAPEAYFQEAGRGGRDEKRAYAVLLTDEADMLELEKRANMQFPPFDRIKAIYNFVCNYLQLPVNAGKDAVYSFDLLDFCKKFKINPLECHHALKFIEQDGLFTYIENPESQHRFMFILDHLKVYEFELLNPAFEPMIKTLLRSYSGLFTDFSVIHPRELAQKLGLTEDKVKQMLAYFHKIDLARYYPAVEKPQIYFNMERQHPDRLPISSARYKKRIDAFQQRVSAMLDYVNDQRTCRSVKLVSYFGEHDAKPCGKCDVCIEQQTKQGIDERVSKSMEIILESLKERALEVNELKQINGIDKALLFPALRRLIDMELIKEDEKHRFVRV
ncbi:MAG: ATP-dependent DNA helicase RecQ [Flavobacteriales bacterium]